MKKVLYIATTADNRNRLDGETVKNRVLREYLEENKNLELIIVDTDNWKKHIFSLIFKILKNIRKADKVIVSSADRGAHIILNFFNVIKLKKDIYYFVIGGHLYDNILNKKWTINTYARLKKIYVEANELKDKLNTLGINNVETIRNFRKVEPFENQYKKDGKIKFVFYARIIKEKGIEDAVELVKRLNNENINCILDIYGQGDKNYIEELKTKFNKNISYCGEIKPNNKVEYEILSKYDILLFPTKFISEGLPGSLIDSYIASLGVIASNWIFAKEYIKDGENGYIYKFDDIDDMYNKTVDMIKNNKISKFKQKSKELSKDFLIENVLNDFNNEIGE